jgi:hypothetical protein
MDAGLGNASIDADLTTLAIPDAAIGDAGLTVLSCYTCLVNQCRMQLATCDVDRTCNPAVATIPGCLATGMSRIGECAAVLQGNAAGGGVLGCLEQNCIRTCSGLPGGG